MVEFDGIKLRYHTVEEAMEIQEKWKIKIAKN